MKYTTEYMQQLFESINFDLFEDGLDMPGFFVLDKQMYKYVKTTLELPYDFDGICIPTEKTYLVGVHYKLDAHSFFATLVHELIHVHLFEKYNYGGHGKKFKKICQKAVDIYYPPVI